MLHMSTYVKGYHWQLEESITCQIQIQRTRPLPRNYWMKPQLPARFYSLHLSIGVLRSHWSTFVASPTGSAHYLSHFYGTNSTTVCFTVWWHSAKFCVFKMTHLCLNFLKLRTLSFQLILSRLNYILKINKAVSNGLLLYEIKFMFLYTKISRQPLTLWS